MCADICKRLGRAGRKPPGTFLLAIWLALYMQLIQCIICQLGILQIVYSQRIIEKQLMPTLSLVTTWTLFGAKFGKVRY